MWEGYEKVVAGDKIDVLLVMGDAIDGSADKSKGTEAITTDRMEQADWATECIKYTKAKKVHMVAGTPYHVGQQEDWERVIGDRLGAEFTGQDWLDIDGVVFNVRHKVGSSSIPHGRHTAISRQKMWEVLWKDTAGYPESDILLRGHVHFFSYCGGCYSNNWLAMTLPALQGPGSRYGVRQCEGLVHFGGVDFWTEKGEYSWRANIREVQVGSRKPKVL